MVTRFGGFPMARLGVARSCLYAGAILKERYTSATDSKRRRGRKLQRCNGAPQPPIKTQILYTTIHFADPGFEPESGPKQGCLSWECIFCNEGFEIYTNGNAKASAAEIARHCEVTWMIWLRTA